MHISARGLTIDNTHQLCCKHEVSPILGNWSGCLERKGEERGDADKHKGGEMIPREFLLQKRDRESDEDDERDDLLYDLELET